MYRIAVADDEAKACTMIKEIIQQYFEAKALECRVQAYQRPTEMVWDMEKGAGFDIYCIDIEMPGISGMELAHQIRQTEHSGNGGLSPVASVCGQILCGRNGDHRDLHGCAADGVF